MILHTINAPPASAAFTDCLLVVESGDAIVLLGDGVYAALAGTEACARLQGCSAPIHVLQSDADAAGVTSHIEGARIIDMNEFVALSEQFPRQQAWY